MLILRRGENERIFIRHKVDGTEIVLTIVEIKGKRAAIGLDAPKDFDISREEILPDDDGKKRK